MVALELVVENMVIQLRNIRAFVTVSAEVKIIPSILTRNTLKLFKPIADLASRKKQRAVRSLILIWDRLIA